MLLRKVFKDKDEPLTKKKLIILSAVSAVVLLGLAVLFPLTANPHEWDVFSMMRAVLVIVFSWFAAVIDQKFRVIPNKLTLCVLLVGMAVIAAEIILSSDTWQGVIMYALLGAAISGGIFLIANLVSKNGLGMGDVKLMALIGLYVGMERSLGIAMWTMVLAALTGGVLMMVKKAKLKTELALAPFFFLGAAVSNAMFLITGLFIE